MTSMNIDICPCCKKSVNDEEGAVKCEVFCKNWFHCSCVSITDQEYECMRILAEKSKWVCGPCDLRLTKVTSKFNDIDGFINLSSTVDKLVNLVKGIIDDNVLLNNRIDILSSITQPAKTTEPEVNNLSGNIDDIDVDVCSVNPNSSITEQSINGPAVLSVEQVNRTSTGRHGKAKADDSPSYASVVSSFKRRPMSSISTEMNGGPSDKSSDGWKVSTNKGRRNHPQLKSSKPIIGTKTSDNTVSKVKAVSRLQWVFVSRLAIDCTKEDIVGYLTDSGIEGECVAITPKHDSYRSFRVGVEPDLTSKLLDSNFWPVGTLVSDFIFKKPRSDYVASRTFLGRIKNSQ